jgi:hypothetical protein
MNYSKEEGEKPDTFSSKQVEEKPRACLAKSNSIFTTRRISCMPEGKERLVKNPSRLLKIGGN